MQSCLEKVHSKFSWRTLSNCVEALFYWIPRYQKLWPFSPSNLVTYVLWMHSHKSNLAMGWFYAFIGHTALHHAAVGGYEDVVQLLIASGANVEEQNENGHTPLMESASAGHVGVAKILLQAGAGINTHSNEFKESALTLACYKGTQASVLCFSALNFAITVLDTK